MKEEINLLKKAVVILIEMAVEYFQPPDTATYETFEKHQRQINKLNQIKSKLEE